MRDFDSPSEKPFIVASEKALPALPRWLKERGCNTYSFSSQRRINVGYDTKPDSDWGGRYSKRGTIVIVNEALFDKVCKAINKAYGYPDEEA